MKPEQHIDKNKFSIPDGYFDEMESAVLSKTVEATHTSRSHLGRYWMQIAAGLIGLAAVVFLWKSASHNPILTTSNSEPALYLADIETELFQELFSTTSDRETLDELADFIIELEEF